jgi:hypothetical protein
MNADAAERCIEAFVAKYTPAIAAQLRDARQAVAPHREALAAAAPLTTVIKAEAEKQRPRRAAATKA